MTKDQENNKITLIDLLAQRLDFILLQTRQNTKENTKVTLIDLLAQRLNLTVFQFS